MMYYYDEEHLLRPDAGHATDAIAEAKFSFVLTIIVGQALRHAAEKVKVKVRVK